jgi:hypothetical protein
METLVVNATVRDRLTLLSRLRDSHWTPKVAADLLRINHRQAERLAAPRVSPLCGKHSRQPHPAG